MIRFNAYIYIDLRNAWALQKKVLKLSFLFIIYTLWFGYLRVIFLPQIPAEVLSSVVLFQIYVAHTNLTTKSPYYQDVDNSNQHEYKAYLLPDTLGFQFTMTGLYFITVSTKKLAGVECVYLRSGRYLSYLDAVMCMLNLPLAQDLQLSVRGIFQANILCVQRLR